MRHIKLALLVSMAIVLMAGAPASAINVAGCNVPGQTTPGEFLIYANTFIGFESGAVNLTGDIIARGANSTVRVGANNRIVGSVTAANLFVSTGAVVDVCNTSNKTGPGTCVVTNAFVPPAACTFPPLPVPVFPAVCAPGGNVVVSADGTLAPGCYNQVRVNAGVTLTLQAGGDYFVNQELRQLTDSTLQSDTPGTAANVVIKGNYVSQTSTVARDLNITTLAGPGTSGNIGNASILDNVLFYAPNGRIHPHTGTLLSGTTELVALSLQVEAITNTPPPTNFCQCPAGQQPMGGPVACVPCPGGICP